MNKKNSCKICRSVETKLFLKGKKCFTSACPVEKANVKKNSKKRYNENVKRSVKPYLTQILEKRKVLARYNVTFSQLKKYFIISKKNQSLIPWSGKKKFGKVLFF